MFLVGVYGFIFTSFMVSIVLLKLQRKKMYQAAETFYMYAEWMVSVILFTRASRKLEFFGYFTDQKMKPAN